jgi:hypothetical protein
VPRAAAAIVAALACAAVTSVATPERADARMELGVYQDSPVTGVPRLARTVGGHGTKVISVYVTAGRPLDPAIVRLARTRRARLMVSWMPDAGRDGSKGARHRLRAVSAGRHDRSLRALVRQIRGLRPAPILRPMPEPNTPWYAWSGTTKGNSAKAYVKAFRHVRGVTRRSGGRVRVLWAPYVRSVPEAPGNAIADYFPGAAHVDLVGVSGYNFGKKGGLAWADPEPLFADAYREITALSPKRFWIAETGSTGRGGDKAAWIQALGRLRPAMPLLAGVVWYDVRDRNGDFRIRQSGKTTRAFRALARTAS